MILSREEVAKIAHLARLALTDEELATYRRQLSAVLEYAERLNQVDIDDVPPTSSAVPLHNVMRQDEVKPSMPTEDALHNAARVAQNQFEIQAVLDE